MISCEESDSAAAEDGETWRLQLYLGVSLELKSMHNAYGIG